MLVVAERSYEPPKCGLVVENELIVQGLVAVSTFPADAMPEYRRSLLPLTVTVAPATTPMPEAVPVAPAPVVEESNVQVPLLRWNSSHTTPPPKLSEVLKVAVSVPVALDGALNR